MMDSVGTKRDLQEMGTRYDHYMELKEIFMTGIEVINGMVEAHRTPGDTATKKKLEGAVEVIDKQLLYLSDYDKQVVFFADLPKTLRDIEKERKRVQAARLKLEERNGSHTEDPGIGGGSQDSTAPPDDERGI
jgi:hypothetical protein